MRTVGLKMLLVAALGSCAAFAQNSDLAFLDGITGPTAHGNFGSNFEITYARELLGTRAGDLYLEFPLIYGSNAAGNLEILFTPGVRLKVPIQSRVSLYGVAGVGVASFGATAAAVRTTSGAFEVGGGFDVRLTRLLSLRAEARDFATRRGLGGFIGRNHPIYSVGIGLHF
jgi:opacity protein-like surface antigen